MTIETPNLRLVPLAAEELLALFDGSSLSDRLGAADELQAFCVSSVNETSAAWFEKLRASSGIDPWLHGFAVVLRDENRAIGIVSFKGPPDESGMVEIAYGIVPSGRGRGHATEGAAALVDFASRDDRVRLIRAHTMPTPNASTRVLGKCGFANVGEVVDPEDGPVWRWERRPAEKIESPPIES
jgi:RimJ/RimL family protein N-acetyltransferase